jgi:transcriptional regulator with XRE-family HTH domain
MDDNELNNNQKKVLIDWDSVWFATRLKAVMGENSVYRFAQKCGFTESTLRKYLAGDSIPGADKLVHMAQVADVSLQWLALGKGDRSGSGGWDRITPTQLAVVLEFERFAQRRTDLGIRDAVKSFVEKYNQGVLELGQIGEIQRVTDDELILWRDLAWERRVEKSSIDEAILCEAIEVADAVVATSGKAMESAKRAKLITAIYRLSVTMEGGVDRSMILNLLRTIS